VLALVLVFPAAVTSAGAVWLKVATTLRAPDPVSIPKRPQVAAVMWSNRVFVDRAELERWIDVRDRSYTVWAREHPAAAAVLDGRVRRR
jgi:hypothetical protein